MNNRLVSNYSNEELGNIRNFMCAVMKIHHVTASDGRCGLPYSLFLLLYVGMKNRIRITGWCQGIVLG